MAIAAATVEASEAVAAVGDNNPTEHIATAAKRQTTTPRTIAAANDTTMADKVAPYSSDRLAGDDTAEPTATATAAEANAMSSSWMADTGASHEICKDRYGSKTFKKLLPPLPIKLGSIESLLWS